MIKKLVSFVMAAVIFTASVSAASINTLSRGPLTIKNESSLAYVELQIEPLNEVETGSSIFITLTNATVFSQAVIDGTESDKNEYGYNGSGYQWGWDMSQSFDDIMPTTDSAQLPYYIKRISDVQYEIYLINVPDVYANNSLSRVNGVGRTPYYSIPIVAYADGAGDITMTIDSNGTSISDSLLGNFEIYDSNGYTGSDTTTTTEAATETTTESADSDNSTSSDSSIKAEITMGADYILVNDERVAIDVSAYIQESTSSALVPLRAVSEIFGGSDSVEWIAETKTAVVKYNGNEIQFIANGDYMLVNGEEKEMANGAKAEITEGRMFVPFRALGEALGLTVSWDSNSKTAMFNS